MVGVLTEHKLAFNAAKKDDKEASSRAASNFHSQLYSESAMHIGRMSDAIFNKTDVNKVIDRTDKDRQEKYPKIECRLGDPTQYPGLHSYSGFYRHLLRYVKFHPSSDTDGYEPGGDPALTERLREGSLHIPGHVDVPDHVEVYITPGVAGALRLICEALIFPPNGHFPDLARIESLVDEVKKKEAIEDVVKFLDSLLDSIRKGVTPHNAVMPEWTYVSHLAETFRVHGDVKLCKIHIEDGQIDLESLKATIDKDTRVVVFATVGNPLCTAMKPEVFDDVLLIVQKKMMEYGHPIVVIADTIYEHFRMDQGSRIDPIQRAIHLADETAEGEKAQEYHKGPQVPVVDVSSFSKMMAIPGHRVGFLRLLWDPELFTAERQKFVDNLNYMQTLLELNAQRHDVALAMTNLYSPQLCPVNRLAQKAIAELYAAINRGDPVEEELAPIVAVLASLKGLSDKKGSGDTPTLMHDGESNDIIRELGLDPRVWFTANELAKTTRKIADLAQGYGVKLTSTKVNEIAELLCEKGLLERIEVVKEKSEYNLIGHKVDMNRLISELPEEEKEVRDAATTIIDYAKRKLSQIGEMIHEPKAEKFRRIFYRLKKDIPPVPRLPDGMLNLYGISKDSEWKKMATLCGVHSEDYLYEEHKRFMRETAHERVFYLAKGFDRLRKEGHGISLFPAYYGPDGQLDESRFNSFYLLVRIDAISKYSPNASQSARLAIKCVENKPLPMVLTTPGELFVTYEMRGDDTSYMRIVALQPKEVSDEILRIFKLVAMESQPKDDAEPKNPSP